MEADILLDWEYKSVKIYVNETYYGESNFYHEDVEAVDTVLLYNLNPSTSSWWKNI